ncbi:MAG: hypothetical protein R2795_02290 [Saprospiraceae bacterium]
MKGYIALCVAWCMSLGYVNAQVQPIKGCQIAFDEIDPFDSLKIVGSEVVALGYMIPSKYETEDGPKMVEEARAVVVFTENDSISGFFLNLVLPEYKLQPIGDGDNVKLLLEDSTVIGLYNFPDEGAFDRNINMRVYQHTCAVPMDYYYKLVYQRITQLRIEYKNQYRTLKLSESQQLALKKAFQCVGNRVSLYPIHP